MKKYNIDGENSRESYAVSNGVEIIPAIMPDSYDDLKQKARRVKGMVSCVQIDVMDGKFVPSVSWPYNSHGQEQFVAMVKKGDTLPFGEEDIAYGIDFMVEHPKHVVEDWLMLGARRIIVHLEGPDDPREILALLSKRHSKEKEYTGVSPVEFGIAIGAHTSLDRLQQYIYDVDVVQFMGIEKIGYQGEKFYEGVVERITHLRQEYPHIIISVDGGVNFESAPKLIKAGATRLVSGSTIFESSNIRTTISKLAQV